MGDPTRPMALTRWVVASTISLLLIGALVAFNSSERTLPSLGPSFDVQDPTSELASSVGGFLRGTRGSNVCPAGSVSVGTEAQCRSAASALGGTFQRAMNVNGNPNGCFETFDGCLYFNKVVMVQPAYPQAMLICAESTANPTASPTAAPTDTPTAASTDTPTAAPSAEQMRRR